MGIVCVVVKVGSKLGYITPTDTMATASGFTDFGIASATGMGLETKTILDAIDEKNSELSAAT